MAQYYSHAGFAKNPQEAPGRVRLFGQSTVRKASFMGLPELPVEGA